jgi:hypothetical protein
MLKRVTILAFLAVLSGVLFLSPGCRKDEKFPVIPHIEFLEFVKFGNDSADFHITFTDGDGDIGLDQSDTLPPYDSASGNAENIYMLYYQKDTATGQWVTYELSPSDSIPNPLSYNYRIPRVLTEGQNKALEGEIIIHMYPPFNVQNPFKYEVYIKDRALHQSNKILSPELNF